MAGGLPYARVLEDRRVDRDDVVVLLQHRSPPSVLDVVLQQHPVVAVVVGGADAPVDLRGGKDEAAALAQRDDLVHRDDITVRGGGRCVLGWLSLAHRRAWYSTSGHTSLTSR